jgi:hypothetical protein
MIVSKVTLSRDDLEMGVEAQNSRGKIKRTWTNPKGSIPGSTYSMLEALHSNQYEGK